ncbi:hypothetical protein JRQ81_010826, partial [Phrynocephalus forsythii]
MTEELNSALACLKIKPDGGPSQVLSQHPPSGSACSETAAQENHGSSESETEQATPRSKKPRRSRTIFTELQLMGLEKKFQKQKYLSTPDRLDLAQSLGLTQLQVLKGGQEAPTKPKGRPKKNSIPTSEEIEAEEKMNRQAQKLESEEEQAGQENQINKEQSDASSETQELSEPK